MAETKRLRLGVIGAWGRGRLALHAHDPENGLEVVAGADIDETARRKFKERFPAALITDDYRRLLERPEIDAVFVTTPDFLHEEHAVAALEAGKDVYLEKPMAITIEGCDRILRAAFDGRRKLYVGHNMRHFAVMEKMKEIIDRGEIGEVKAGWCRHFVSYGGDAYFKDWHAERRNSTGLLLQKGAHDIDILHWLCGGFSKRVTALGGLTLYDRAPGRRLPERTDRPRWSAEHWPPLSQTGLNPVIDVEDLNLMLMELDNGVFASYQQCHYTPDAWRNYTIIGTRGRIENLGDLPGRAAVRVWNRRNDDYNPFGDIQYFVPAAAGGHGGADPRVVNEFVRYLREGCRIRTSAVAARYSVAAGVQATDSLRSQGAPRLVPEVDPELAAYFNADLIERIAPKEGT